MARLLQHRAARNEHQNANVTARHYSLKDVEHSEGRLYLVFEWLEKDLKKFMDSVKGKLDIPLVKVRLELKGGANNLKHCAFCVC